MKVAEAIEKVQREAQTRQTLAKQEADSSIKLAQQKIASLEATIASLLGENIEFKQQLDKATNHIKDIAVSVVEGARKEAVQQIKTVSSDSGK